MGILKPKGVISMESKKKIHKQKPTKDIIKAFRAEGRDDITSDVLGSYTGNPSDDLMPEQDADDL